MPSSNFGGSLIDEMARSRITGILARLLLGVEVMSIVCAVSGIRAAQAGLQNEASEPNPNPQVEVSESSDYFEARELLGKQKWIEAAIVLRAVLKRTPDFTPASISLASALLELHRREEGLSVLSSAILRQKGAKKAFLIRRMRVSSRIFFTNEDFQFYQDGLNLLNLGKYGPARERLEKALSAEPDNAEILTRLGQCLTLQSDYDSAVERLRLAKALNPYEPEIQLWLGRALSERGQLSEAIPELQDAYKALGQSELSVLWLAEALSASSQKPAAAKLLEASVNADPFHLSALLALARLQSQSPNAHDSASLLAAQRELRLGLSRLDHYGALRDIPFEDASDDLSLDLRPSVETLRGQIEGTLSELESRIVQAS